MVRVMLMIRSVESAEVTVVSLFFCNSKQSTIQQLFDSQQMSIFFFDSDGDDAQCLNRGRSQRCCREMCDEKKNRRRRESDSK